MNTYFRASGFKLKLREEGRSAQLVPYARPDRAGDRRSLYAVLPVADAAFCRRSLSGLLGIRVVVEKAREVWLIENTRVHLDRVRGLGTFVELETVSPPGTRAECRRVLARLGLAGARTIAGSYADLASSRQGGAL